MQKTRRYQMETTMVVGTNKIVCVRKLRMENAFQFNGNLIFWPAYRRIGYSASASI